MALIRGFRPEKPASLSMNDQLAGDLGKRIKELEEVSLAFLYSWVLKLAGK
jgi:hypothetical protein